MRLFGIDVLDGVEISLEGSKTEDGGRVILWKIINKKNGFVLNCSCSDRIGDDYMKIKLMDFLEASGFDGDVIFKELNDESMRSHASMTLESLGIK